MDEYKIYLSIPNAGSIMPCALQAALFATTKLKVVPKPVQFGDIPHNFNMMFCEALQMRQSDGITHFAMLHTDIGAVNGWLDILVDELDRVDADIMSTINTIKDGRGLTTTGIRYPRTWGTRRYTMKEIFRLPETFSIADTAEPDAILAINTGLWVCRLPIDGWPDRFPGFQNEHRITWRGPEPCPEFDSEDWLFSSWAAEQGLKVYATRKVMAFHRGGNDFYNSAIWGSWETELQPPTRPLDHPIPDPGVTIETDFPIAIDSMDHKQPLGTRIDNSSSASFLRKLTELVPSDRLRVLDLGCSGGGFVRSVLDLGGFAIGIEGSDFSRIRKRNEWEMIPTHLFTADATKPFTLRNGAPEPIKFNVFTGWEFWEHIAEEDIDAVIENILRHAAEGAVFIGSISSSVEPHHPTAHPKAWWIERFARDFEGGSLFHDEEWEKHFGEDLVRGGADPDGISFSIAFKMYGTPHCQDHSKSVAIVSA